MVSKMVIMAQRDEDTFYMLLKESVGFVSWRRDHLSMHKFWGTVNAFFHNVVTSF